MKAVLIISAIILVLYVYIKIKMKHRVGNPIDTIHFAGCMGINIGDSWDFVLSRMVYLNLITKETAQNYEEAYKKWQQEDGSSFMELSVGRFYVEEHFNNIKSIQFEIKDGTLDCIEMSFEGEQTDTKSVVDIVKDKLTARLGEPKENKVGEHFFMWGGINTTTLLILNDTDNTLMLNKASMW